MTMTPYPAEAAHSVAEIPTDKGSRYLQQLAKHFAHKIPVTFDAHAGEIVFSMGTCQMTATETGLTLSLTAPDPTTLPALQNVVESHLVRFAFREELTVTWRPLA